MDFPPGHEEWLDEFTRAARQAAERWLGGWPPCESLPPATDLVAAMCAAYDEAVDAPAEAPVIQVEQTSGDWRLAIAGHPVEATGRTLPAATDRLAARLLDYAADLESRGGHATLQEPALLKWVDKVAETGVSAALGMRVQGSPVTRVSE